MTSWGFRGTRDGLAGAVQDGGADRFSVDGHGGLHDRFRKRRHWIGDGESAVETAFRRVSVRRSV